MIKHILTHYPNYQIKSYKEYNNDILTHEEYYNTKGNSKATIRGYHPNGMPNIEKNLKNGVLHGTCIEWDSNGIICLKENYKNGLYHGKRYDNKKNILKKENYKNGLRHGIFYVYHPKDILRFKIKYVKNELIYKRQYRLNGTSFLWHYNDNSF